MFFSFLFFVFRFNTLSLFNVQSYVVFSMIEPTLLFVSVISSYCYGCGVAVDLALNLFAVEYY